MTVVEARVPFDQLLFNHYRCDEFGFIIRKIYIWRSTKIPYKATRLFVETSYKHRMTTLNKTKIKENLNFIKIV